MLIQDYHFALLPRLIREKLPNAIIITFWHIPWPNAEVFSVCPWREQILEGLLGSSILGFHIQLHCNNFIESVDRFLESRIDREGAAISLWRRDDAGALLSDLDRVAGTSARETARRCAPASARTLRPAGRHEDRGRRRAARLHQGHTRPLPRARRVLPPAFRLDRPRWSSCRWRRRAGPACPPTSSFTRNASALVAEINERYGRDGYQPIILHRRASEPRRSSPSFYRAADVCVVSSLHDGMNLVAKEFVAARDDEAGVLVLSAFAGASRELLEALHRQPVRSERARARPSSRR